MFYTLHKNDNGETVNVKANDRIVIALEETPNSEIKWIWVNNPALTLVDESKKTENSKTEIRVFRFDINTSFTDITFNLIDPFKTNASVMDTFKFSIVVK